MSIITTTRRASVDEIIAEMDRQGQVIERLEAERDRLLEAVLFADKRAVSRAAYPHACIENRKLRDLIDVALGRASPHSPLQDRDGEVSRG